MAPIGIGNCVALSERTGLASLSNLCRDQNASPNQARGYKQQLAPDQPSRPTQVETGDRGHPVGASEDKQHATERKNPIGKRDEALCISDYPRLAGSIGHHLPERRYDNVAEKYDHTE